MGLMKERGISEISSEEEASTGNETQRICWQIFCGIQRQAERRCLILRCLEKECTIRSTHWCSFVTSHSAHAALGPCLCVLGFATGSILTGFISLHDNSFPVLHSGPPFTTVHPLSRCLAHFLSLHSYFFSPAVWQFDTCL